MFLKLGIFYVIIGWSLPTMFQGQNAPSMRTGQQRTSSGKVK